MLECKLCDYYKTIGSNHASYVETAKCGFTGVLFSNDVEALNMEYPCRSVSYDQYLESVKKPVKSVNTFNFGDDWRYVYKHRHASNALDRYNRRAI